MTISFKVKVKQNFHGASYKEYTDFLDSRVQAEAKNKKSESQVRGYVKMFLWSGIWVATSFISNLVRWASRRVCQ